MLTRAFSPSLYRRVGGSLQKPSSSSLFFLYRASSYPTTINDMKRDEASTPPKPKPSLPRKAARHIKGVVRKMVSKDKENSKEENDKRTNEENDKDDYKTEKRNSPPKDKEKAEKDLVQKMQCRPPICLQPVKDQIDIGLSFSGCGFLGTYHFGVVKCFVVNGQPLMSRLRRVSGASAGSLVSALFLLSPQNLEKGLNTVYELADELNSLKFGALSPGFYLAQRLLKIVDDHLPDDVSRANHRLFVSLTHYKSRDNLLVSEFRNRAHLIECLNASCYIPLYSMGMNAQPPEIDGQPYIDGGYSNNLPDFSDLRTITVSPFSGAVDISPGDQQGAIFDWKMTLGNQVMKVNLRNVVRGAQALFPPSKNTLEQYYKQGYKDAMKFLLENQLLQREKGSVV